MSLHEKFFSVLPIKAIHRTMPLLIKNEVTKPIIERSKAIRKIAGSH